MTRNRIYFISDVHLGLDAPHPSESGKEDTLIAFLHAIRRDAEVLYILGDLFEFWFEYRTAVPTAGARVLFELYALVRSGVRVVYIPGNHDIWLGPYLTRQVGLECTDGPVTVVHHGRTLHLCHGDESRTDRLFRASRAVLRNRTCITLFRLLHPDLGALLARWTSRVSSYHARLNPCPSLDWPLAHARHVIRRDVDIFLCGHFHRVLKKEVDGGVMVFLGDWLRGFGTYAVLENGAIDLKKWPDDGWEWREELR